MDWIAGAVTASDTPKIRAMQISIEDLFNERRLWWRIEEADKTRYSAQSGYFISSDPEKIPACD
jgi:hypothetical protein